MCQIPLSKEPAIRMEHRPLGQGCEDWPAVFRALRTSAPEALIVLESDQLAANRESLEQARRFLGTSDAP